VPLALASYNTSTELARSCTALGLLGPNSPVHSITEPRYTCMLLYTSLPDVGYQMPARHKYFWASCEPSSATHALLQAHLYAHVGCVVGCCAVVLVCRSVSQCACMEIKGRWLWLSSWCLTTQVQRFTHAFRASVYTGVTWRCCCHSEGTLCCTMCPCCVSIQLLAWSVWETPCCRCGVCVPRPSNFKFCTLEPGSKDWGAVPCQGSMGGSPGWLGGWVGAC
jgi:hypothetical protein